MWAVHEAGTCPSSSELKSHAEELFLGKEEQKFGPRSGQIQLTELK